VGREGGEGGGGSGHTGVIGCSANAVANKCKISNIKDTKYIQMNCLYAKNALITYCARITVEIQKWVHSWQAASG
jgi:hypothetical protein